MPDNGKAAVASGGQGQDLRAASSLPQSHDTTGQAYAQGRVVGEVRGGVFLGQAVDRGNTLYLAEPRAGLPQHPSLLAKVGALRLLREALEGRRGVGR